MRSFAASEPVIADRLTADDDTLWIPGTGLSRAEMNVRSLWRAIAEPGADTALRMAITDAALAAARLACERARSGPG